MTTPTTDYVSGLGDPWRAPLLGVWYAVALHLTWATLLVLDAAPTHVTGLYALSQIWPNRYGLAVVLFVVAICASIGVLMPRLRVTKIVLLVPQQLVLGVSAAGAVRAMWLGHFADGVPRPHYFIIADQMPQVLALLVHSATILFLALLSKRLWK